MVPASVRMRKRSCIHRDDEGGVSAPTGKGVVARNSGKEGGTV